MIRPEMKRLSVYLLKFFISGALLFYLFFLSGTVDVQEVLEVLKHTRLFMLIPAFLICICGALVSAKRWSLFLPEDMVFSRLVSLYFIGYFFNTFLPGRVGGEVIKTFYIYKDTGRGSVSIASVFLDRYMGISAMVGISLIAFTAGYPAFKGTYIAWLIPAVCGIFLITSILLWRVDWGKIKGMTDFYTSIMDYATRKGALYKGLILSFIIQAISISEIYILSIALGLSVPLIYFFIFVPVINAITTIPVTIAGLGLREVGFTMLFSMFFERLGATANQAVSLSLLILLVMITVNMIGGIEYIRMKKLPGKTHSS
jgi:uncharacterized membrane protein YbhN (UPF0104 family)